jgi:membrane protein YqaA with SNARE-associated domain
MTSWGIGRVLAWRYPGRTLEQKHHVAVERVRRYGRAALLLSWVPIVGDPLCVAAGWLRVSWWQSLVLIGAGKAARYGAMVLALG